MCFRRPFCLFMFLVIAFISTVAHAQEMANQSGQNVTEMKFTKFPGLPTCTEGSVQNGDPASGPSIIFVKATAGCAVPWHWHTPNEHLMMVTGNAHLEMKDGKSLMLRPGGFALMPSRHAHQFTCQGPCSLYIYSDAAFDIHYVDAKGDEIPAADALKPTNKKPRMK